MKQSVILLLAVLTFPQCTQKAPSSNLVAITDATIITGRLKDPIDEGVILVEEGKISAIGNKAEVIIPEGTLIKSYAGKFIMPGIINAHGHIGGTSGLKAIYSEENVLRDLSTNAFYGVTTVFSLGGDEEASVRIRNQQDSVTNNMSRLFIAGDVITGRTPEEARTMVDKNAALGVNVIKIRVDDNLGTTEKMKPEIYEAVIDQANKHNLPVAAHIFYLDDAKRLLKLGVRMIAHSVRDVEVDEEFIQLMKDSRAYYCPTLMREVSTYVYEEVPSFFNDPFFLAKVDTSAINQLKDPTKQLQVKESKAAQQYKQALLIAKKNLKLLSDAGIPVAFGTDTGPPGRFHGYFEHLELEEMVNSGMTSEEVIRSATETAAKCLDKKELGSLEEGHAADFIVLGQNPLNDIRNSRTIESVWINGVEIQR